MNTRTVSLRAPRRSRQGMTLIEVIVAMVILTILAILAVTALFYPRLLVVNSGLEQSAIHAGIAEIERHLDDFQTPTPRTVNGFNTDGWALSDDKFTTTTNILDDADSGGNPGEYVRIKTSVKYRDGKTVDLITYRSRLPAGSQR